MSPAIPLEHARRLALHAQGLALPPSAGTTVSDVVARIGCLQLDPVGIVARSPLLVLRARMRGGTHDGHARALHQTTYVERRLFDYWCHEASLCHVDDLPLHRWAMRTHLARLSPARTHRTEWLESNVEFAEHVEADLRARGPVRARELEDRSAAAWEWGHWTDEVSSRQTIARLLDLLWMQGRIGVGDRRGTERLWQDMERCVAAGALAAVDSEPLGQETVVRAAVLRAVGMLGVARATHITAHFTRRRYPGLQAALAQLEASGHLQRVGVAGLRGEWWARPADLEAASGLEPGRRTLALSPFDNVLCDRGRTAELFGFDHRLEIYVPPAKRRWGYYVLPVLHGERFVARADLRTEPGDGGSVLRILETHHEPGRRAPGAVTRALDGLARWRGSSPG
ncbi:MAG: DNA glycosylase AlkZ-like family protein [Thermoleophilaceae bacterium]